MGNFESSIHRPLRLRVRPDLQATRVESLDATTWVIKDPLTLEHYQFSAEEYSLLNWLRRDVSIAELQRLFADAHPPQTISPEAVWDFVGRLHEAGLVMSSAAGQGDELLARMRRDQAKRWSLAWGSLLAIRFRGIDPDSFLAAAHNRIRWLISPLLLVPILAIIVFALRLVVGHFAEFTHRLPELSALFDARNLPWLLVAIGTVKVLHELGHAMVCKHFGGEVRELGFMLLVFAPCLYCDVSDAWRFPNKWRRIAVSAAGIAVEIVLAALATIVWWYAQPGIAQLVALNIMIICSLNTVLVNGNPLLRYDGYYVVSDLVNMPNLWQRSRDALDRYVSQWFLKNRYDQNGDDPLVPAGRRPWLALYAFASKTYLAVVLVGILWGLVAWLHPYRLDNLAFLAGIIVVGGTLVSPISKATQIARNPIRRAQVQKGRFAMAAAVALAAIAGILALPVSYNVRAPIVLMPSDAARISATIDGVLTEAVPAGQSVKRGDVVGQLANTDMHMELERLKGEVRLRELRVEHLKRLRGLDRESNDELPTARAALADSERRLKELQGDARRLTLVAPQDGIIIPPPNRAGDGHTDPIRLAAWSGAILDAMNSGAYLEPGTLVCMVGNPSRLSAVMLVDDINVKRLHTGQPVRLRIDQLPGQVIEGEVVDVARYEARVGQGEPHRQADMQALFAGALPPEHIGAIYQARVEFEPRSEALVIGGRGEAKVAAERITLARLILRYLAQTFRFPV